jgi:hypothetical protein
MNNTEHLLTILSEECVETAQRVSKAIRFGLTEVQEGQHLNNAERLVYEFNDIVAVMELLHEKGLIPTVIDGEAINKKKKKIEKYITYSQELGIVK